jgi:hypothetical protein
MPTVHVFVSTGRFRSSDELRAYIDPDYDEEDEDGDRIPSPFMTEVGLTRYEPMCIEAIPSESGHPVPLARPGLHLVGLEPPPQPLWLRSRPLASSPNTHGAGTGVAAATNPMH